MVVLQTIDRFEASASMNVVSARGGVFDDITLVELADIEAASSERKIRNGSLLISLRTIATRFLTTSIYWKMVVCMLLLLTKMIRRH